jgi:hypothetical protein
MQVSKNLLGCSSESLLRSLPIEHISDTRYILLFVSNTAGSTHAPTYRLREQCSSFVNDVSVLCGQDIQVAATDISGEPGPTTSLQRKGDSFEASLERIEGLPSLKYSIIEMRAKPTSLHFLEVSVTKSSTFSTDG